VGTEGAYGPPGAELQRLYDAEAVDRYIAQLQAHIGDLQSQVDEAVRVAQQAQHKAVSATNAEAMLGRAMLSAQRMADDTIADAERHAELLLADARREADRLLGDVRAHAQRIVDEAHETVETVFAALASQRDQQPAGQPEPETAVFPPPPTPPTPVWAAPDPASRQPDEEDDVVESWGPASASRHHRDDDVADASAVHGEGTIVDLRPGRSGIPSGPQAARTPPGTGSALALGGTGTEGRPLPALARRAEPAQSPIVRPTRSDLLDRWRMARSGPTAADDEFISRQTQLDSLADGSYVSQLRGDSGPAVGDRGVQREARRFRFSRLLLTHLMLRSSGPAR
jgi:hypothetical protein